MKAKTRLMKIGCMLLAVLLLVPAFAACGNGGNDGGTVTTAAQSSDGTAPVPHYDWGGRPFQVLCTHNEHEPNFEVVGNSSGDIVEQSAFSRNNWIEDYYNVEILDVGKETDDQNKLIQTAIASGDSPYDLVFLQRSNMSSAIVNGYMKDLNQLLYLDFTHDWYNDYTVASMEVGDRLFHLASSFSLVDKARTNVLFFNRDLASEYYQGKDDVIQLVRDGDWTVEKMLEYAKGYDIDGVDGMSLSDRWGVVLGGNEAPSVFWTGLGNKTISFDEEGNWSVNLASDRSILSVDKLKLLFNAESSFTGNHFGTYDDPYDTFISNRAFFFGSSLSGIKSVSENAPFAYSVIPYPKFDADQQEYYTTNDNVYCSTFGVPQCAADANFSGFMIEVLSWRSHTTTYPAFTETVCKVRGSYDAVCYEMLELTLKGLTFDFGLMYSIGTKPGPRTILVNSIMQPETAISTEYKKVQEAMEGTSDSPGKLPNLLTVIANLDD